VSAVLSDDAVLGILRPGEHGSTFGGNPLGAAVARMALKVLVEEGMIENSAMLGEYFLDGLKKIESDMVAEVRGRGLMLAIEFKPEATTAKSIVYALKDRGILTKDTHETTIRITPPLVITRDEIDWALEQFAAVLM
jgi:ornithine--oxo-acid transaminase